MDTVSVSRCERIWPVFEPLPSPAWSVVINFLPNSKPECEPRQKVMPTHGHENARERPGRRNIVLEEMANCSDKSGVLDMKGIFGLIPALAPGWKIKCFFEWSPGPEILILSLNYSLDSPQTPNISDRDTSLATCACSRCELRAP